jgi:hypothetical protein
MGAIVFTSTSTTPLSENFETVGRIGFFAWWVPGLWGLRHLFEVINYKIRMPLRIFLTFLLGFVMSVFFYAIALGCYHVFVK